MYCSNCGKEISEETAFCPHCGNAVNASSPAPESIKNTAGSFFRSLQEKAKNVSESINAASENVKKEEKKEQAEQAEKPITNTPRKQTKRYTGKQEGRFIEDTFVNGVLSCYGTVLIDRTTGVNYLFVHKADCGGLTVLVDENGKPLVTKEVIAEDTGEPDEEE